MKTQIILFLVLANIAIAAAQESVQKNAEFEKKNVLYVNPLNLAAQNYTFTYERFTSSHHSYKIMLSGSEKENYAALAYDWNFYPFKKSAVNYFGGLSLTGYECPLEAGVPISRPVNEFFEGDEDQYSVSLQLVNGALMKLFNRLYFEIDGKIGPEYNLSAKQYRWIWSVNINLGVPF